MSGLGGTGVEVPFCETWMVCIEVDRRSLAHEIGFMRVTVRTIQIHSPIISTASICFLECESSNMSLTNAGIQIKLCWRWYLNGSLA